MKSCGNKQEMSLTFYRIKMFKHQIFDRVLIFPHNKIIEKCCIQATHLLGMQLKKEIESKQI